MLFDIHSHILPDIDDGAESLEESLKLLEMLKAGGVDAVAATPHFYAEAVDFEEYSAEVDSRFELLSKHLTDDMPRMIKGFEVRYFKGISNTSAVKSLTLGGSKYILVEFTYGQDIDGKTVDDIADIYYNFGITPILAHIERYCRYRGFKNALELVDSGIAMAHVNAASFTDGYKKAAIKMVDSKVATLLATDTHSVLSRPPMLNEAKAIITKTLGGKVLDELFENSEKLYNEIVK